jgi:hypothetical protein
MVSPASMLVSDCLVVGIINEAWQWDSDEMIEIGIVVAEHKDGRSSNGHFGDYAENVLKNIK